jgi:hypothetical protein
MWPFSETNAAAMRTLKTQPTPNRQWETKDQQDVTVAVCTDNLNAGVAVMKSAQDGA